MSSLNDILTPVDQSDEKIVGLESNDSSASSVKISVPTRKVSSFAVGYTDCMTSSTWLFSNSPRSLDLKASATFACFAVVDSN